MVSPRAVKAYLLAAGLAAGLAQVVLFRELLVIAAGAELVVGLVLAVWLTGAAAGSAWADRAATNPIALARRGWRLAWLGAPALAFGILALRAARPVLATVPNALAAHLPAHGKLAHLFGRLIAVQPGEALGLGHILVVACVAVLPAAVVCGAQFVTGARLLGRGRAGAAYALDALGHLAGGVALALALAVWVDAMLVAAVSAPLYAAAGFALLPPPKGRAGLAAGAGGLILLLLLAALAPVSRPWRWPRQQVLAERSSVYGLVTVARQSGGGAYFFENGVPTGESPPTPRMEVLVSFALLQTPRPRRVLLIGGGVSGGVAEVLKHRPERVDYVEFDPVFLELARRWAADADRRALEDPRVRCLAMDPRLFLRGAAEAYDAIVVALPAPTTALLNRFYTEEWFGLCRRALADDGVVAFSLPYSQVYRSGLLGRMDRCLVWSARRSAAPALPPAGGVPIALMAGDDLTVALALRGGALATGATSLTRRLAARAVDSPYLQAYAWDWMEPQNLGQAREMLAGDAMRNTDLRPAGALLGTVYWLAQVTPTAGTALERLLPRDDSRAPLATFLLALPALLGMGRVALARRTAVGALWLMFCVGTAGMAQETALLMLLQTRYGYVYGLVGVLVGAFMLGVALAAWYAEARRLRPRAALAASGAALLISAGLVLAVCATARPLPWIVFAGLALLSGTAVGAAFPAAVEAAREGSTARVGSVYAADLLGGVLAALLVPALVIPIAGVVATVGLSALATALFALGLAAALHR